MKRTSFTASLMVLAALLAGKSEGQQPPSQQQQISIQKVYGNDETHTFTCEGTNEIKAYNVTLHVKASSSGGGGGGGGPTSGGNSGLTGTL